MPIFSSITPAKQLVYSEVKLSSLTALESVKLALLDWLHARLHLYTYQVPSAATASAWEGCLQHLVRGTQKLKGVGPCSRCWQIFTSYRFVCQIHCDRLSQAGKDPIKAESRTSKLLFALLWMRLADCSCVCLGGCWVFWALLSPAGSAVFLARRGHPPPPPAPGCWGFCDWSVGMTPSDQWSPFCESLALEDIWDSWTFRLLTTNTCVCALMCLWLGLILQVVKAKLTVQSPVLVHCCYLVSGT